ncbi:MAG: PHP domain-containing protein [Firmicutes bacterium]|nr:PHP domain-containing protein [Bacillota bacterium]
MKYQAHRGVEREFPENTIPAFQAAIAQGYDYIEVDPNFTLDGKCVLLHDNTLNRTCRYLDGSPINDEISITDITYEQALEYDAGIAKSFKFRGTQIPLLSELLELVKDTDVTVKLDNKIQRFNEEQLNALFETVELSGSKVAFTLTEPVYIKKVAERFNDSEIHYDGYVDEQRIIEIKKMLKNNPLTVWLCIPSPETSWVTVPKADEEICKMVKKYARLGLWILTDYSQFEQAKRFNADIIETRGQIKPLRAVSGMVDCHTHTYFSHDSKCNPKDSYRVASAKKLAGFAVTDHCDIESYSEVGIEPIYKSYKAAKSLNSNDENLYVFSGIEIGEMIWCRTATDEIIRSRNFDIVLGSIHATKTHGIYSQIDFSAFSDDEMDLFLKEYFNDVAVMAANCDFDVLSHLTCPLRYICGKYKKSVDLNKYVNVIDEILKTIIVKGIALEVNTSCLGSHYSFLMPDIPILKRYRELGGYLITLGSDAHDSENIARGFDFARKALLDAWFINAYYFRKRIPFQYSLEDIKYEV